jgi:gamma-glutamylcyclotransferase (GGCT)/AIG2-like uncharacterized protein YtfP
MEWCAFGAREGWTGAERLPLFTYGSLRSGGRHAGRMRGARLLGRGTVRGRVVTHAGYPALMPGQESVPGDLWAVPDRLWGELDAFEDAYGEDEPRSVYVRRAVDVQTASGPARAWAYALHPRWWP